MKAKMKAKKKPGAIKRTLDSLYSALTGIGQGKAASASFTRGRRLQPTELTNMWDFSWLTKKIVSMPVDDALQVAMEISAEDDKIAGYLRSRWYALDAKEKIKQALYWSRLYGGGALVLLVKERKATAPEKPLIPANISEIVNIRVADLSELVPQTWYTDPLSPKYGDPETFTYNPGSTGASLTTGITIHESRVIFFKGIPTPAQSTAVTEKWWGGSLIQHIYEEILAASIFEDCTTELAQDFVSRIFKMTNLADLIEAGQEEQVRTRIDLINKLTPHRTAVIDKDEELEKQQAPITGYEALIGYFADLIAGASGIPRAKLFSQQLGTLAGAEETTGDYDRLLLAIQERTTRQIDRLFEVIAAEQGAPKANIKTDEYEWEYGALHPRDDKAITEARKIQADIDNIYITAGVLSPDEVLANRFGGGAYSYETTIEIGDEADENDDEEIIEEPEPMTDAAPAAPRATKTIDAAREAQTFIVPKSIAKTREQAAEIAKKYGATIGSIRETAESWRFRQRSPEDFVNGSFKTFEVPESRGVVIIFGTIKGK